MTMYNDDIYEFSATILKRLYYSEDSTWGIFKFSTTDEIPYHDDSSVKSDIDGYLSTLTGKMQELSVGAKYIVKAKLKKDKKYGYQYTPISVYADIPKTHEEQVMFLKSIIPEKTANNLLEVYPNIVEDVANGVVKDIDLTKVSGVGEYTWDRIKTKIIDNYLISDILVMLQPLGVTYKMIQKLLNSEPNAVLLKKQIEENPYVLTKIQSLGFKKVDDLALKLKPELFESKHRLIAFITYYLTELGDNDGHTWVSLEILKKEINNNIPECEKFLDWVIKNSTDYLYIDDVNKRIGLKYYRKVEMEILDILIEKAKKITPIQLTDEQIDKAIKNAEKEQGFQYVAEQLEVIKGCLNNTVSLITGKAGTGKTSIMRAIIGAYKNNKYDITASALSAMAAQRIAEATSFDAMTIHRTLGAEGLNRFKFNMDNKLITNVAFIDEGSMVNARLFLDWLRAIDDKTRIIISGDHKQLPPIGFGNVFSDLLDTLPDENVFKLTKPMRQAEKSGILVDANLIRENINPVSSPTLKVVHGELQDMHYMFRTNRESLFDIAVTTYLKAITSDGIDEVVIAVPRKQGCRNSTHDINNVIQNRLLGNEKKSIGFIQEFKLGARVMQTANDYDKNIFNGEIGTITKIYKEENDKGKIVKLCEVNFGNKIVTYEEKDVSQLDLAYAMTVHKLQGAGRKTVIGIIDNTHYQLLDNCMLYTLLTRAKKRCLLLAEPQAFLKCIRTSHNCRNTWMQLEMES